jgi:hypothetical protein
MIIGRPFSFVQSEIGKLSHFLKFRIKSITLNVGNNLEFDI